MLKVGFDGRPSNGCCSRPACRCGRPSGRHAGRCAGAGPRRARGSRPVARPADCLVRAQAQRCRAALEPCSRACRAARSSAGRSPTPDEPCRGAAAPQDGIDLAADTLAVDLCAGVDAIDQRADAAGRRHGGLAGLCRAARLPAIAQPRARRAGRSRSRARRSRCAWPCVATANCWPGLPRSTDACSRCRPARGRRGRAAADFMFQP